MDPMSARVLSLHQPDLLPWSGFWYKLAKSDLMDLRIDAQIVKSPGYQRRVRMADRWNNVVLAEGQSMKVPIREVVIQPGATAANLINHTRARYAGAPYRHRLDPLYDAITDAASGTELLWEFNVALLEYLRGELGIDTPFFDSGPTTAGKAEGVLEVLQRYSECVVYLSGNGAKKYMADTTIFDEAGIQVQWTIHAPITSDSVTTLIAHYDDPMEHIMAEYGD